MTFGRSTSDPRGTEQQSAALESCGWLLSVVADPCDSVGHIAAMNITARNAIEATLNSGERNALASRVDECSMNPLYKRRRFRSVNQKAAQSASHRQTDSKPLPNG